MFLQYGHAIVVRVLVLLLVLQLLLGTVGIERLERDLVLCDLLGAPGGAFPPPQRRDAATAEELLRNLGPALLEVHHSVRDLNVDGLDHHLDVERAQQAVAHFVQSVCN